MRLALAALTGLTALLAAPASAQTDTLRVVAGVTPLDASWIAAGEATYAIRLIAPMQQDIGTATERTTLADGVVTRVTRVSVPMQGMNVTDSLRADAATLAPMTHHTTGGPRALALEFSPEGVVGMAGGEAVVVPMDIPVFDASWIGEVAQSLPFAEGLVATVPAYDGQRGVVTYVLRVTGQQEASGAGAPETAWIVEATSGGVSGTYAISAATRQMLRTRFSPQPGVTIEIVRR